MQDPLSYLKKNHTSILSDLEKLVEARSPSTDKSLVDQCGRVLSEIFLERLGVEAEIIPQEHAGDHLRFCVGTGEKQLLILGHFDTVHDSEHFVYRVEGNKAFGPGVQDMKGGIIQAIWAVKACQDLGIGLNHKIVFLCTSDEELGSPNSREWIEQEAIRSEFVFVVEPSVSHTGALKTTRKGTGRFQIVIEGKSAHAGTHHEEGISALEEMAHQILYLQGLTDYEKGTTINVGIAQGGTRYNVVPEQAELYVDVRATTVAEAQRIEALIRASKPVLPGSRLLIEGEFTRPPMEQSEHSERLFQIAKQCGEKLGMEIAGEMSGGGSDGNFTAALGIPTLDGLGAFGAGLHTEQEYILIDQIPLRTALLTGLIVNV